MAKAKFPKWIRVVRDGSVPRYSIDGEKMTGPKAVARHLKFLENEVVECFVAIFCDAQHNIISSSIITRGLVNTSLVHPRETFRLAIMEGAVAICIGHNHPTGVVTPSPDDKAITSQLVAAGRLLDIPVHDHIIIGRDGAYFSFAESGLM